MKVLSITFILSSLIFSSDHFSLNANYGARYFSKGSIYNINDNINVKMYLADLTVQRKVKNLFFKSQFNFLVGENIMDSLIYFDPYLNVENSRGFQNNQKRWYQFSSAEVNYKKNDFLMYFGKLKRFYGEGNSSLILSRNAPSFPQAGFVWDITNNLSFEYFNGSLLSQIKDTTSLNFYSNIGKRNTYYSRSVAAHKIEWNITKNLKFCGVELIIFGNRSIDYTYLIPFIPFWSAQSYNGDIDNLQLFGEICYSKDKTKVYSSLFIDEWRPEWTFDKINRNWFGYQLGLIKSNLLKKNDNFQFEYTWTDHRVYRHRFPINDSYSNGYSLGFWAGPHSEEILFIYEIASNNFTVNFQATNVKRGELTNKMLNEQYNESQEADFYKRYSNIHESRTIYSMKVEKEVFVKGKVYLESQFITWRNPGFNPKVPYMRENYIEKLSFNMGLDYHVSLKL